MKPRPALAVLLALAAGTAAAQVDPALYGQLHWRLVGPFRGGRVLAVAGVPGEPDHFFFGAVNGVAVWYRPQGRRTPDEISDAGTPDRTSATTARITFAALTRYSLLALDLAGSARVTNSYTPCSLASANASNSIAA